MTREAKIGLLVALAFLLVIGILLSDHVSTATREPPAPLSGIEQNIRGSTSAPGAGVTPNINTPPVLPEQTVAAETSPYVLDPRTGAGGMQVGVGQPELAGGPVARNTDPWTNEQGGAQQPEINIGANMLAGTPEALQQAAREAGEELVPVGNAGGAETLINHPPISPQTQPDSGGDTLAGVKEYKIQPGDSLSKITAKFLGRDNPANRAIIYQLNPDLKANPNRIIVGKTCQVPAGPDAVEKLRTGAKEASVPQRTASNDPPRRQQQESAGKTYTVKPGDTLWQIAADQLGSGVRHKEILKLNSSLIKDADDIVVGMKLKLPA